MAGRRTVSGCSSSVAFQPAAIAALQAGAERGLEVAELLARTRLRQANVATYERAWQRYAWPTNELAGA